MNTVFKFYFQAWILWAIGGASALAGFAQADGSQDGRAPGRAVRAPHRFRALALAPLVLPILAGLVYTPLAVGARAREYGDHPTLDGAAHLARRDPGDYAAIQWLNDNARGTPVVLEATGGSYEYAARISAHTGLPTVLGWPGHERQWRGSSAYQAGREEDVATIYAAEHLDATQALLESYDVQYIVIGNLERSTYGPAGPARLASQLTPVFSLEGTTVYVR
jgi:uncharacterized membrane protein